MPELINTPFIDNEYLKAYYRFESGALTTDSSGNNHTLVEISDPAETVGRYGGAVVFDSNDAYSINDHADFKPTGAFTIGGWVRSSTSGTNRYIFASYSQNTFVAGISLYINSSNSLSLVSGRNTGTTAHVDYETMLATTPTINDGNPHQVVGTWNGEYLKVYADGVLIGTPMEWANAPGYAATNYVRLGCKNNSGTNTLFLGDLLDDFFIINGQALTDDEILSLYHETATITSKSSIFNSNYPLLDGTSLPCPTSSSREYLLMKTDTLTFGGTSNWDIFGRKYKYKLNYDFISVADYELLETIVNELEEKNFIWNKYLGTSAGITVLAELSTRQPVTPGNLETEFYSKVTLTLTEVSSRI